MMEFSTFSCRIFPYRISDNTMNHTPDHRPEIPLDVLP